MNQNTGPVGSLERFFSRYYPDPIVFTIGLTAITFVICILATPMGPTEAVVSWGDGLPSLLAFIAQISITLILAHALANTAPVAAALRFIGSIPQSTWQAYVLVGLVSTALSLVNGAFGLIGGAMFARSVGQAAYAKGISVHYPLLVATAYAGVSLWHMGYSGSAPLFVATPGHSLEAVMGIVPVTQTTYTWWNGAALLASVIVLCLTAVLLHPKSTAKNSAPPDELDPVKLRNESKTPAAGLDNSRIITLGLAAVLLVYLIIGFGSGNLSIDLNTINWSIIVACLIFVRSPVELMNLLSRAAPIVAPVLLHFPFYGGMMALMIDSGLVTILSSIIADIATSQTLPLLAFLTAGLLNMFVPSGGGQWVVQGPIFIDAADTLGVTKEYIVMAVAYGDQWTNLLQPFWALPALAIAGLQVRDIFGFCFCFLISLGAVFGLSLLLFSMI